MARGFPKDRFETANLKICSIGYSVNKELSLKLPDDLILTHVSASRIDRPGFTKSFCLKYEGAEVVKLTPEKANPNVHLNRPDALLEAADWVDSKIQELETLSKELRKEEQECRFGDDNIEI